MVKYLVVPNVDQLTLRASILYVYKICERNIFIFMWNLMSEIVKKVIFITGMSHTFTLTTQNVFRSENVASQNMIWIKQMFGTQFCHVRISEKSNQFILVMFLRIRHPAWSFVLRNPSNSRTAISCNLESSSGYSEESLKYFTLFIQHFSFVLTHCPNKMSIRLSCVNVKCIFSTAHSGIFVIL